MNGVTVQLVWHINNLIARPVAVSGQLRAHSSFFTRLFQCLRDSQHALVLLCRRGRTFNYNRIVTVISYVRGGGGLKTARPNQTCNRESFGVKSQFNVWHERIPPLHLFFLTLLTSGGMGSNTQQLRGMKRLQSTPSKHSHNTPRAPSTTSSQSITLIRDHTT